MLMYENLIEQRKKLVKCLSKKMLYICLIERKKQN